MSQPLWFLLIREWKVRGMGSTGITLPFLVGALAKSESSSPSVQSIRSVIQEIVSNPVPGYVTEVRWCENIDAPVLSTSNESERMPFKSHCSSPTGAISLGFSQDVQSMFGLDCKDPNECLEKLVTQSAGPVESARCSRVRDPQTRQWTFGDFSPKELRFIDDVAALAASQKT